MSGQSHFPHKSPRIWILFHLYMSFSTQRLKCALNDCHTTLIGKQTADQGPTGGLYV